MADQQNRFSALHWLFWIVVSGVVGCAISVSGSLHFSGRAFDDPGDNLIAVGATLVVLFGLRRAHVWLMSKAGKFGRLLVVGLVVVTFLGTIAVNRPSSARWGKVTITALGENNPAARGKEVWLRQMTLGDGQRMSPNDIVTDDGWEKRGEVHLSYKDQPATLEWTGPVIGERSFVIMPKTETPAEKIGSLGWQELSRENPPCNLLFTSHPHSGKVQVKGQGTPVVVDLYNEAQTEKTVEVFPDVGLEPTDVITQKWIAVSSNAMVFAFCVWVLVLALLAIITRIVDEKRKMVWSCLSIACLVFGVGVSTILWPFGLKNIVFKPGTLTIVAAVDGARVLPISLDENGDDVIDIALDEYVHQGRVTVKNINPPDANLAVLGIRNEKGAWTPFEKVCDASTEVIECFGNKKAGVVHPGGPAVAFELDYEYAKIHLWSDNAADATLELDVDGCVWEEKISIKRAGRSAIPLTPKVLPVAMREYSIQLPSIRIEQLGLVLPSEVMRCDIAHVELNIPGVKNIESAKAIDAEKATGILPISGELAYSSKVIVLQGVVFLVVAAFVAIVAFAFLRLIGTGRSSVLVTPREKIFEGILLTLIIGYGVWVHSGIGVLLTNDGVATISRAVKFLETGVPSTLSYPQPAGYAAFLAAIIKFGGSGAAFVPVQKVLFTLLLVMVWWGSRKLGGRLAALVCTFYVATNAVILLASRIVLSDFLLCFLLVVGFLILMSIRGGARRRDWVYGVILALLWAVMVLVRPNALTIMGGIVAAMIIAQGSWLRRAALTGVIVVVGFGTMFGLKHWTTAPNRGPSLNAWMRTWPLMQFGALETTSKSFRELRPLYNEAGTEYELAHPTAFNENILRQGDRRTRLNQELAECVNTSIRYNASTVLKKFGGCATAAYLRASTSQLWGYVPWGLRDKERYDHVVEHHSFKGSQWFSKRVGDTMRTFYSSPPADTRQWAAFMHLHRTALGRLLPLTILAAFGLVYAIRRREGLLILPMVMNLMIAVPLFLMFLNYDRYLLPAELMLVFQAAVGVRAIVEGIGNAVKRGKA